MLTYWLHTRCATNGTVVGMVAFVTPLIHAAIALGGCVSVPGITSPIHTMSAEQKAVVCAQLRSDLANPEWYSGAHADARDALKGNQCPEAN